MCNAFHSIAIELRDSFFFSFYLCGERARSKEDSGMCSEKISLINNFVENIDLFCLCIIVYICVCMYVLRNERDRINGEIERERESERARVKE